MRAFTLPPPPKPEIQPAWRPDAPHLDLEIGAGQGLHAIRYCQANADRVLIAIEKTANKFAGLNQRRQNHPWLKNLHAIHSDAVAFVSHFIADETLDRVFLLYPNPHPKSKQANLRWHNRPFFSLLLRKMKASASLTLATNLQWYADEAKCAFTERWGMQLVEDSIVDSNESPRTHFEKKYLERGEICRNLVFRKCEAGQNRAGMGLIDYAT